MTESVKYRRYEKQTHNWPPVRLLQAVELNSSLLPGVTAHPEPGRKSPSASVRVEDVGRVGLVGGVQGAVDASAVRENHGNQVWSSFGSFIPITKGPNSPLLQVLERLIS